MLGEKNMKVFGAKMWSYSLPNHIKTSGDLEIFKRRIKNQKRNMQMCSSQRIIFVFTALLFKGISFLENIYGNITNS